MKVCKARLLVLLLTGTALVLAGCGLLGRSSVVADPEPVELTVPAFSEWISHRGDWEVIEGRLVQTNASTGDAYINTNAYAPLEQKGSKLIYEWTIEFGQTNLTNGPGAGMHIMSDNATSGLQRGNSYMIWQNVARIEVYRTAGSLGTAVQTWQVPASVNSTHTYQVVVDVASGTLSIFRDGQFVGDVTVDNPILEGQYISARTNATWAAFSDVRVWVVE